VCLVGVVEQTPRSTRAVKAVVVIGHGQVRDYSNGGGSVLIYLHAINPVRRGRQLQQHARGPVVLVRRRMRSLAKKLGASASPRSIADACSVLNLVLCMMSASAALSVERPGQAGCLARGPGTNTNDCTARNIGSGIFFVAAGRGGAPGAGCSTDGREGMGAR
jgi:hypothetical protein